MISLELSVREALLVYEKLLSVVGMEGTAVRERIAQAIERATVHTSAKEEASLTVYSMNPERFIDCIKALRAVTHWELKESKEFFGVVRGPLSRFDEDSNSTQWAGGSYNTLNGFSKSDCEKLADELRVLGCDCSVSVR
jgi:ribosomal protein L7/L12